MGGALHSALTVRPPNRWHNHKLFFAVVFVVAVAALFQWGNIKFRQRHGASYKATAAIRLPQAAGAGNAIVPAKGEPPLDYAACLASVARQLDQPETTQQVLTELADKGLGGARTAAARDEARGINPSVAISAQPQSSLQVSIQPLGDSPHQIFITCTSSNQSLALSLVNGLAARGADLFRETCRSKLQAAVACAAEEFERADAALAQAQRNIDEFLAFLSQKPGAEGGFSGRHTPDMVQPSTGAPDGKAPGIGVPEPKYRELVENPRWTELQLKLQHLEHQRAILLVDRTEAHPAVQQTEAAIAEARRQLAATPQWHQAPSAQRHQAQLPRQSGAAPEADVLGSPPRAGISEPQSAGFPEPVVSQQQQATIQGLKQSLADAQQRAAQAAFKYEQAMAAARVIPEVEVRWATGCQGIAPAVPFARLLLAALGSGLAATIGVCLIGVGVTAENLVVTKTEVEARLPVAVVGVIPAESPGVEPRTFRFRQRLARWGNMLLGMVLVAGALVAFLAS